ncbi:GTP cyclohydrolase MptA [Methanocella conradii HZ254]|uniref:GTP cyclohydrolase MptA n=1 Tax=Methanocella conradii (strain DSM 24694 / JCM 17849 / CGMCC 1.5162 / HZ254) TaxID=1041930 RepID=H8I6Y8_METCZ|nr:GTP cyclohydrolase MptA [Methanocella conradii]AFC99818.1 GTP cyclohydrolase MptA [Methanocella conradii HZ254]
MTLLDVLPDVQATKSEVAINLSRVGVTNVKKLVKVARAGKRPIILISTFNMYVDLPSDRRGANLSRNFEVIDEVLEESVKSPVYEIEDLCGEIARRLLNRHEYATRSEVHMDSELIVKRKTPRTEVISQKVVKVFARAVAERNENIKVKKVIGAEVVGITACPCAQELMKARAEAELKSLGMEQKKIEQFLRKVPMATHNQRGRGTISIEVVGDYKVPLETIIDIIEKSMSTSSFELLKRIDEVEVVSNAHANPKFVEDCVRDMAKNVMNAFPQLPDDAVITLKQVNEESIHQHNAFAELKTTMARLREEIKAKA